MSWAVDEIKPDHSVKISRPRTELERFADRTNDDRMGWLSAFAFQLTFEVTIYDVLGIYL